MESLSIDLRKFENLANRALLIIAHLHKIIEGYQNLISNSTNTGARKREGYDKIVTIGSRTMLLEAHKYREILVFFDYLGDRLGYHYSNFKGIVIAMEKLIKIDEEIKHHIGQIESKIKDNFRFEIGGSDSLNWNNIAEELRRQYLSFRDEESLLRTLIDRLDRFFEKLKHDIDEIIRRKELFDVDEQSKARFFVNLRKLAGIFDEMNKILKQGKPQEKVIRKLFDEVYDLLSHFPKEYAPTEEIELAIQKLEQVYDGM